MKSFKILLLLLSFIISLGVSAKEKLVEVGVYNFEKNNQQDNLLSIVFKNKAQWHTYWKNPGDSGTPISLEFYSKGERVEFQPLEWPRPKRYIGNGNLWAYGYEGQYALFFSYPQELKSNQSEKFPITILAKWLACKEICVPGKREIKGYLKNYQFFPESDKDENEVLNVTPAELKAYHKKVPQVKSLPPTLKIYLASIDKNKLAFHYSIPKGEEEIFKKVNLLLPFPKNLYDFKHESLYKDDEMIYGRMHLDWDGEYEEPPINLPEDGVFNPLEKFKFIFTNPSTKESSVIFIPISSFSKSNLKLEESFYRKLKSISLISTSKDSNKKQIVEKESNQEPGKSILFYLLLAFLGGVILNFMPCVLPVISLKLFHLIKTKGENKKLILYSNLYYTLGVLTCFLLLATVVLLLKRSGELIGWGFHLQSPLFVGLMIIFIFIFALSFFDLFEFRVPNFKIFSQQKLSENMYLESYLEGVLATLLSTPCSAPFLGTALTFAFTGSVFSIYASFLSIGLGLASPFVLVGLFPKAANILPSPGTWMDGLKKIMGLCLLLTIIWLYDVFLALDVTQPLILLINLNLAFFFFSFYWYKAKRRFTVFTGAMFCLSLISLFTFFYLSNRSFEARAKMKEASPLTTANMTFTEIQKGSESNFVWHRWTPAQVEEEISKGNNVFVDFTAKWCFTCKVNEKLVLQSETFKKLVRKYNIKLFLA